MGHTQLVGLESFRKKMGLTQAQLAKKMNVERYRIADWEQGRSEPSLSNLIVLSNVLNASIEELLGVEGCRMSEPSNSIIFIPIINDPAKNNFYSVKLIKPYSDLKAGTKGAILEKYDDNTFKVKFVNKRNKVLDICKISKDYLEINSEFEINERNKLLKNMIKSF